MKHILNRIFSAALPRWVGITRKQRAGLCLLFVISVAHAADLDKGIDKPVTAVKTGLIIALVYSSRRWLNLPAQQIAIVNLRSNSIVTRGKGVMAEGSHELSALTALVHPSDLPSLMVDLSPGEECTVRVRVDAGQWRHHDLTLRCLEPDRFAVWGVDASTDAANECVQSASDAILGFACGPRSRSTNDVLSVLTKLRDTCCVNDLTLMEVQEGSSSSQSLLLSTTYPVGSPVRDWLESSPVIPSPETSDEHSQPLFTVFEADDEDTPWPQAGCVVTYGQLQLTIALGSASIPTEPYRRCIASVLKSLERHRQLDRLISEYEARTEVLRRRFSFSPVAKALCCLDGTILEANPAFSRLFTGSRHGQVSSWSRVSATPLTRLPVNSDAMRIPVTRTDGSRGWVGASITHLGDIKQVLVECFDITVEMDERNKRERVVSEMAHLVDRSRRLTTEQRRMIATELHHDVLQRIAALRFQVLLLADDSDARLRANEGFDELVDSIRQSISRVRPSRLERDGLKSAVLTEVHLLESLGIAVAADIEACQDVPAEAGSIVFRILQELLTNVHVHAQATSCSLGIDVTEETIDIVVIDNGVGFDYDTRSPLNHFGLEMLHDMAEAAGGSLAVRSAKDQGSTITVKLPSMSNLLLDASGF